MSSLALALFVSCLTPEIIASINSYQWFDINTKHETDIIFINYFTFDRNYSGVAAGYLKDIVSRSQKRAVVMVSQKYGYDIDSPG